MIVFCNRCGAEIPEGSNYCPKCGQMLGNGFGYRKKTTFKDGIVALFNKLFLFEGKSSRSEFNYGYLFLIIISTVLAMFSVTPEMTDIYIAAEDTAVLEQMLADYMSSKDILSSFNLYNIAVALIMAIFLCAPVYRRLTDCGFAKKIVGLLTVIFVVSQVLCSTLLWCLLPVDIYDTVSYLLEILSYANLIILLLCMFKRSAR